MATQYYDGSFYTFVVGPSWNEAKSNAEKLGGQLVSINTAEEQQFIYDNFVVNADKDIWIGLSDTEVEGNFKWLDGTPLNYANWAPNEPSNGGNQEDWVHIWSPIHGTYSCE